MKASDYNGDVMALLKDVSRKLLRNKESESREIKKLKKELFEVRNMVDKLVNEIETLQQEHEEEINIVQKEIQEAYEEQMEKELKQNQAKLQEIREVLPYIILILDPC